MTLGAGAIRAAIADGRIVLEDTFEGAISVNSVDVRLGPEMWVLEPREGGYPIDPYADSSALFTKVEPLDGTLFHLQAGRLYLASTIERIGTRVLTAAQRDAGLRALCPDIGAKSTAGRWGLTVALCAGKGDVGYASRWTLEVRPAVSIVLKVGTVIAQVRFTEVVGEAPDYAAKPDNYAGELRQLPKPLKVIS